MQSIKKLFGRFIIAITKPFVSLALKFEVPFSKKEITGLEYLYIKDEMQMFDLIFTTTHGELTNLMNVSDFKHGAFYMGRGDLKCYDKCVYTHLVNEYTPADNGHTESLITTLTACDRFAVYRLNFDLTVADAIKLEAIAKNLIHGNYDRDFKRGNDDFYCFEYIMTVLKTAFPELEFEIKELLGVKYIDSSCFTNDTKNFKKVFDSLSIKKD